MLTLASRSHTARVVARTLSASLSTIIPTAAAAAAIITVRPPPPPLNPTQTQP